MSAPYLTKWSEDRVLAYFWTMVHADADRIALLKQISGVKIERPDDWDRAAQRAMAPPQTRATTICFSCFTGDRRLYWHHVIAIQHGGSTHLQNLVPICLKCHAMVHPWLDVSGPSEERRRRTGNWTRVGDMIVKMAEEGTDLHEAAKEAHAESQTPRVPRV
jgi:hypothetical protein